MVNLPHQTEESLKAPLSESRLVVNTTDSSEASRIKDNYNRLTQTSNGTSRDRNDQKEHLCRPSQSHPQIEMESMDQRNLALRTSGSKSQQGPIATDSNGSAPVAPGLPEPFSQQLFKSSEPALSIAVQPVPTTHINGQAHDRSVLILYGTETGNSEDVAERIAYMAERIHFETRVCEMDLIEMKELLRHTIIIFVIGTTGQGEFPQNAKKLWKSLLRKRLSPNCLSQMNFTTFGLGDSSYPKYNWSVRKLHKRLEQLGGREIYPRGEADDQHEYGINGTFRPWNLDLGKHLLAQYPLPEGKNPIPDDVLLPSKIFLKLVDLEDGPSSPAGHDAMDEGQNKVQSTPTDILLSSNTLFPTPVHTQNNTKSELAKMDKIRYRPGYNDIDPPGDEYRQAAAEDYPQHQKVKADSKFERERDLKSTVSKEVLSAIRPSDIPGSTIVMLYSNKRITPVTHEQDVRELSILASLNTRPPPGSTITIYPKNDSKDAQLLIDMMDWGDVADKQVDIEDRTANNLGFRLSEPVGIEQNQFCSLRHLLEDRLDITAVPKQNFFGIMASYCHDETERERLLDLVKSEDDYITYAWKKRRTILETLGDFPSVKLPWQDAVSYFKIIRGRQYSIANGGSQQDCGLGIFNCQLQLLVAVVKYRTVMKKHRIGLATRYLADLPEGHAMKVDITCGGNFSKISAASSAAPKLMIATGTGLAPIRSLAWHHARAIPKPLESPNLLIFGCRNPDADYYYKDEWTLPGLQVDVKTAFSRVKGQNRIYVQHLIRDVETANRIRKMVKEQNATIYVCGSSGAMPKAVRASLEFALSEGARSAEDEVEAQKYLEDLEKSGRYVQETW